MPDRQSLLLNVLGNGPMSWLHRGMYFFFLQICALFLFYSLRGDDTTICAAFSTFVVLAETYQTLHASERLQTTYDITGRYCHDG